MFAALAIYSQRGYLLQVAQAWRPHMRLITARPEEVPDELKEQAHALTRNAFRDDQEAYDHWAGAPSLLILCIKEHTVVGHLATYVRQAFVEQRPLKLGLIGGVVVDETHRRRGYAKAMILEAHDYFRTQSIEFAILFAIDPDTYRSSGYREMRNNTRFLDRDGAWKDHVYRGGMVAELADQPWRDQYLDLCGPTV